VVGRSASNLKAISVAQVRGRECDDGSFGHESEPLLPLLLDYSDLHLLGSGWQALDCLGLRRWCPRWYPCILHSQSDCCHTGPARKHARRFSIFPQSAGIPPPTSQFFEFDALLFHGFTPQAGGSVTERPVVMRLMPDPSVSIVKMSWLPSELVRSLANTIFVPSGE